MNIQVKSVDSTHAECVVRIKKKYADIKGLEDLTNEYKSEELTKLIEIQIEQTKKKISLLEQSLQHNETIPTYFKKMLENSRSHHLVNVEWFEGLLKDIRNEN